MLKGALKILRHPRLRKYTSLVSEDLAATYSRDLHKWLIVAPAVGIAAGLVTTGIASVILGELWPSLLGIMLLHHGAILPILLTGFVMAGLLMQYLAPDPNEHSTEEIIRSYHLRQGSVNMRPFIPKLLAAITTVGFGGSAALEGPGIYGGGAAGSWLWTRFRRLGLESRDRRIMLISGAAAGMAAVFRAPLTGLIFALEMPYKDDLAHEALVPALIASVVSYLTLASFMGAGPLFDFVGGRSFSRADLLWSAGLGAVCGLVVMAFDITFGRFRAFVARLRVPHWTKLAGGGCLAGLSGLAFVSIYPGALIPLGPNYEAVGDVLTHHYGPAELVVFAFMKLAATLFSLGVGGVSAMFVPLFLAGGAFGKAYALSVVHAPSPDLFAAVGMAAFIAGGYKTPLTAVVFVAEATGGHAYIIPALIGAAVAYTVSGEASVSQDQRLHEGINVEQLREVSISKLMQREVISIPASATLGEFFERVRTGRPHRVFPVLNGDILIGTVSLRVLAQVDPPKWCETPVQEVLDQDTTCVQEACGLFEALGHLSGSRAPHMVLVTGPAGELRGVVTMSDVLKAIHAQLGGHEGASST